MHQELSNNQFILWVVQVGQPPHFYVCKLKAQNTSCRMRKSPKNILHFSMHLYNIKPIPQALFLPSNISVKTDTEIYVLYKKYPYLITPLPLINMNQLLS